MRPPPPPLCWCPPARPRSPPAPPLALAAGEELLPELSKDIVGAADAALEIGYSNALTVNLHLMMAAFYRPAGKRNKIMIEAAAFPSDRYATGSHILHHGLDPKECLIEITKSDDLEPAVENYGVLPTERIIAQIDAHKDELALVMLRLVPGFS